MASKFAAGFVALALITATPVAAPAKAPDTWDDLHRVKSDRLDEVYLLPNADFRGYTKVKLDPVEVSFKHNWLRDYNRSTVNLSARISDAEARKILDVARAGFETIFAKTYADAGYQVVTESGPDVLRLRTAVINLSIVAPNPMSAARSHTFSREAGSATLVLEARDSLSGAVLGRAIDAREIGDSLVHVRNSVTNRSDFEQAFSRWAKLSVKGLTELKALSPIDANAQAARK